MAVQAPAGRGRLPRPSDQWQGLAVGRWRLDHLTPGDVIEYDTITPSSPRTTEGSGSRPPAVRAGSATRPRGNPEAGPPRPRADSEDLPRHDELMASPSPAPGATTATRSTSGASTPSRSAIHLVKRPTPSWQADRAAVGRRIDAVPTAAMVVTRWRELTQKHARSGRMVVR